VNDEVIYCGGLSVIVKYIGVLHERRGHCQRLWVEANI
jgi:hypothetical protein